MNYRITMTGERMGSGIFSASNAHTAISRALTGIPPGHRHGPCHVGYVNDVLKIGEEVTIKIQRL